MIIANIALLVSSLPSLLAAPQICAGCPADSEVDQDIVTFVVAKLSLGECQKNNVKVQNFRTQVVAGTKYIFDLVENPSECLDGENGRTEETCHVEVLSQPWMDSTEVLWDQTTCTRLEEEEESIPCLGCVDDSEVDQDIVEFVMTELSYGDCQRSNVKVENFQSQVVAGKKYIFELVQSPGQCGNNEESRCHIEVLSQPWLDNTEVLWDETTCERAPKAVKAERDEEISFPCVGCADDSEVNQEIVEFVMSELSYGDCLRSNVKVENFKSQVVAGTKYIFDLVQSAGQCGNNNEETRCHIEVLSQPWLNNTEILSDETTCERVSEEEEKTFPCVGCADESEVNQEIVEFVMTELSYGDCQRSNVKVENFKSQVVAGKKYIFDLVQSAGQCGNNDEETRCHIEVLSQPWLNNTEILTDETTCTRE